MAQYVSKPKKIFNYSVKNMKYFYLLCKIKNNLSIKYYTVIMKILNFIINFIQKKKITSMFL